MQHFEGAGGGGWVLGIFLKKIPHNQNRWKNHSRGAMGEKLIKCLLFFCGHHSLIKNNMQTTVINMFITTVCELFLKCLLLKTKSCDLFLKNSCTSKNFALLPLPHPPKNMYNIKENFPTLPTTPPPPLCLSASFLQKILVRPCRVGPKGTKVEKIEQAKWY